MTRRSDLPIYVGLRGALAALRLAPRPLALAAGAGAGRAARLVGLRRAVTESNLARAFPEMGDRPRAELARRTYAHFGRATVDSMRMSLTGPAAIRGLVDGGEAVQLIEDRLPRGGILVLTGHIGNWELAGAYLAARGYPVTAVVSVPTNPYVAEHAERTRQRLGIQTILMREARYRVPEALRAGRLVALVADQGAARSDLWTPFFGVPTHTPVGPGLFAARTGAPVLFGALLAAPGGRYRLTGDVIDDQPTDNPEEMVERVAARYRARLEALVRTAPEQYLWMHRLWKRSPPPIPGPAAR